MTTASPLASLRTLPSAVVAIGTVSLLTDVSSEMIYPLLPALLATTLGAAPWALGVIEGAAEATAAVFKVLSGWLTDRSGRRKPLMLLGYAISGAARPLVAFASAWPVVLLLRVADRAGKGLRGTPRDALLADLAPPNQRGAAFGLHRAMDHAGAVVGPLVAAGLLGLGLSTQSVFLAAAVPAVAVMVVLWRGVPEAPRPTGTLAPTLVQPPAPALHELPRAYQRFLLAVFVFALGNSTDAFLLLHLRAEGVAAHWIAVLWSLHHGVKVAATTAGGMLSDRLGRRPMVLGGWTVYAAVYLGFATLDGPAATVALFLVYGLYFGLTEPVEKAWVADLVPVGLRGRAFGAWQAAVGLAALPASVAFGLLWTWAGRSAAFGLGAALAVLAVILVLRVPKAAAEQVAR